MIETIFVVLLFVTEFISFVFTAERIKKYDVIKGKLANELNDSEKKAMSLLGLKVIYGIVLLGFLIYGMFITHLLIYCVLSLLVVFINVLINKTETVKQMSQKNRIVYSRFISVVFLLIWLKPFLEILKIAF